MSTMTFIPDIVDSANLSVGGTLTATGALTANSTATVAGALTASGGVTITGTLNPNGGSGSEDQVLTVNSSGNPVWASLPIKIITNDKIDYTNENTKLANGVIYLTDTTNLENGDIIIVTGVSTEDSLINRLGTLETWRTNVESGTTKVIVNSN